MIFRSRPARPLPPPFPKPCLRPKHVKCHWRAIKARRFYNANYALLYRERERRKCCTECQSEYATRKCDTCTDKFCEGCWARIHSTVRALELREHTQHTHPCTVGRRIRRLVVHALGLRGIAAKSTLLMLTTLVLVVVIVAVELQGIPTFTRVQAYCVRRYSSAASTQDLRETRKARRRQ